jgi:glucose-1-phosphate thymidylyltransferase
VVGPYVSIETGSTITGSVVRNSIVRSQVNISDAVIDNSMLGERSSVRGQAMDLSIGDDCTIG